ncbi:MAG TPA: hypothetical protein VGJ95_13980 [Pseudonocardiaceae bacterium]
MPARAAKSSAPSWWLSSAPLDVPAGGTGSGGSRRTVSPNAPSTTRLVANTCSFGQTDSRVSTSRAHSEATCAQLSSTSSARCSAQCCAIVSASGRYGCRGTPSAPATAGATSARSSTGARSTNTTGSKLAARASQAAIATLVLPQPPGPDSVTIRWVSTSSDSVRISLSRPTSGLTGAGSRPAGVGGRAGAGPAAAAAASQTLLARVTSASWGGSPRRMPVSSSRSRLPGSTPSSSPSIPRARC